MVSAHALTVYRRQTDCGGILHDCRGRGRQLHCRLGRYFLVGSGIGDGRRSSHVTALTVYDSKLIAGGCFTTAGGVTADYIAAWDGSSWSALGSGTGSPGLALTVYDGKLIAGGDFKTAGGVAAIDIAAWDGSSWSALGSGVNELVFALTVYDGKLIAGGPFTTAGGWRPVPSRPGTVLHGRPWDRGWEKLSLCLCPDRLRRQADRRGTLHDCRRRGRQLHRGLGRFFMVGIGVGDELRGHALTVYDGKLCAGGAFTTAGGVAANTSRPGTALPGRHWGRG